MATKKTSVLYSSDSKEWYTPTEVLEPVIQVFGAIDLDPCSNSHEAPSVPADAHYTKDDNGLVRDWRGRVFMNPPYGKETRVWAEKLLAEIDADRVQEAIVLVAARVETQWFRMLSNRAHLWCAVSKRLRFSGSKNSAPFPSAIFFFTDTPGRGQDFCRQFCNLGLIYRRVEGTER